MAELLTLLPSLSPSPAEAAISSAVSTSDDESPNVVYDRSSKLGRSSGLMIGTKMPPLLLVPLLSCCCLAAAPSATADSWDSSCCCCATAAASLLRWRSATASWTPPSSSDTV
eukprot:GHUV01014780.1.p4 GENE.GHUV01014780.1~~GHUV01014780.1.p4  ORF type:complete len:113 (-),score=35.45 GHUV01014780.1:1491-1829(-)